MSRIRFSICLLLCCYMFPAFIQAQGIEYAYDQAGNRIGHYLMKLVAGDETKEFKIVRE